MLIIVRNLTSQTLSLNFTLDDGSGYALSLAPRESRNIGEIVTPYMLNLAADIKRFVSLGLISVTFTAQTGDPTPTPGGGGGGSGYNTIQSAGTPLTQRTTLNVLAPLTATDDALNTRTQLGLNAASIGVTSFGLGALSALQVLRANAGATALEGVTLGGAALLGVGTTAGTVAAGDDSRIVGAIQASVLTTNGQLLTRTAGAPAPIARNALGVTEWGPGSATNTQLLGIVAGAVAGIARSGIGVTDFGPGSVSNGQLVQVSGGVITGFTPGTAAAANIGAANGVAGLDANTQQALGALGLAVAAALSQPFRGGTNSPIPGAPSAGRQTIFAWDVVPRLGEILALDPANRLTAMRARVRGVRDYEWQAPSAGTTVPAGNGISVIGLSTGGAISVPTLAAGVVTSQPMLQFTTGTTIGQYAGPYSGTGAGGLGVWRPSTGSNGGGYHEQAGAFPAGVPTGLSAFVGVAEAVAGGTATPISRAHHIGVSVEGTDPGGANPWYVSRRGPAAGPAGTRFALTAGTATGGVSISGVNPNVVNTLNRDNTGMIIVAINNPSDEAAFGITVLLMSTTGVYTEICTALFNTNIPDSTMTGGLVSEFYNRVNVGGTGATVQSAYILGRTGGLASIARA